MIPAGWKVDDDKREAVELLLAALPRQRELLIVACGTIVANLISDIAFERGGGLDDAQSGAASIFHGIATTIEHRWAS